MNAIELKKSLAQGKRIYGTLVVSSSPHWLDAVRNLGVDFVFIDNEHIALDRSTVAYMCQMYKGMDLATVVRIPEPCPYRAAMALDAGANGVLAPYIETVEQVKALVGSVKYRPIKGKKLNDLMEGRIQLSEEEKDYLDKFNKNNMLFLNIESEEGIKNIDKFIDIGGIDGLIIGPHDLSLSIGKPEQYKDPIFKEKVKTIIDRANNRGISAGVHFSTGVEQEIEWCKQGAKIVLSSSDIMGFINFIKGNIDAVKNAMNEDISGNKENFSIDSTTMTHINI